MKKKMNKKLIENLARIGIAVTPEKISGFDAHEIINLERSLQTMNVALEKDKENNEEIKRLTKDVLEKYLAYSSVLKQWYESNRTFPKEKVVDEKLDSYRESSRKLGNFYLSRGLLREALGEFIEGRQKAYIYSQLGEEDNAKIQYLAWWEDLSLDKKVEEMSSINEFEITRDLLYEGIKRMGEKIKDFHIRILDPKKHPNSTLNGNSKLLEYVDALINTYNGEIFTTRNPREENHLSSSQKYLDKDLSINYEKKYFLKSLEDKIGRGEKQNEDTK